MISLNEAMKNELQGINQCVCSVQVRDVAESIISRVKLIRDCIVYDERGILKEENINFGSVLRFVGDWTGYEVSCSEIRLSKDSIPKEQLIDFIHRLSDMLSQIICGGKVVVYISLFDEDMELRFHRYRENEKNWLVDDLNVYGYPIMRLM